MTQVPYAVILAEADFPSTSLPNVISPVLGSFAL
jgi:hypothetical protein